MSYVELSSCRYKIGNSNTSLFRVMLVCKPIKLWWSSVPRWNRDHRCYNLLLTGVGSGFALLQRGVSIFYLFTLSLINWSWFISGVVLKLVIKRWIWIVEGKLEVTCDSLQNGKEVIFQRIMEVMAKLPNCLPEVHNSSSNCDRARDWKSAGIAIFTGRNKSCYLAVTHCAENDITHASV